MVDTSSVMPVETAIMKEQLEAITRRLSTSEDKLASEERARQEVDLRLRQVEDRLKLAAGVAALFGIGGLVGVVYVTNLISSINNADRQVTALSDRVRRAEQETTNLAERNRQSIERVARDTVAAEIGTLRAATKYVLVPGNTCPSSEYTFVGAALWGIDSGNRNAWGQYGFEVAGSPPGIPLSPTIPPGWVAAQVRLCVRQN